MSEYSTVPLDRHMEKHENLVHWVVRRQWLGSLPYLEAVQAGRMGLWRALRLSWPKTVIRSRVCWFKSNNPIVLSILSDRSSNG
jgi:hypothetical protein